MRRTILGADPFAELGDVVARLPEPHRSRYAELLGPAFDPHVTREPGNGSVWMCLAQAIWANRVGRSFAEVVRAAIDLGGDTDTVAAVAGALAGARFGPAGIPSRWSTYVNGTVTHPDGTRTYRLADLQDIARWLVGKGPSPDTPPEPAVGPSELAPGLYAANLAGAATVPSDWAVVSLCRPGTRFHAHPVRRELFLLDDHTNLDPLAAVSDAVASIDAFLAEGRQVVVHCHGGRSRTAVVAKAWAMRRYDFDEPAAHDWLAQRWPLYDPYNEDFVRLLVAEAAALRAERAP